MDYRIEVHPGIYGETTRYSFLLPQCRIGLRTRGKKSTRQISGEYLDWALGNFSGYLAADEIYDGPFCVLFIVDSIRRKRIAYEVLDRDPEKEDVLKFLVLLQL